MLEIIIFPLVSSCIIALIIQQKIVGKSRSYALFTRTPCSFNHEIAENKANKEVVIS
jgi:hypothetical protein